MRLLAAVGLVAFLAGAALAQYLVALDAGDRMTVDGYWEDGDWVHLVLGSDDLSVPRSLIRSVTTVVESDGRPRTAQPADVR
jgi:hypothetical protein